MPDHIDDQDWIRLSRYLARECSVDEQQEVEAWIAGDPSRASLVERLRMAWEHALVPEEAFDVPRAWEEVVRRNAEREAADLSTARRSIVRATDILRPIAPMSARRSWAMMVGIAAAIMLAVGTYVRWHASNAVATAPTWSVVRTYTSPPGQRMRVRLADGTGVVLAPATTLELLGDTIGGKRAFGASGMRAVTLDGEASFDVARDAARPFEVRTAFGTARDLGTEFVVASQSRTKEMRVAVRSGIVALHRTTPVAGDSTPLVTLERGDFARLDVTGTVTLTRGTDVAPYFAWTEGTLVFRGAPLADVVTALARWYDLDIIVADSVLNARRVTATFDNAPAERMLHLLEIVLDIRADKLGRVVTLRKKS